MYRLWPVSDEEARDKIRLRPAGYAETWPQGQPCESFGTKRCQSRTETEQKELNTRNRTSPISLQEAEGLIGNYCELVGRKSRMVMWMFGT